MNISYPPSVMYGQQFQPPPAQMLGTAQATNPSSFYGQGQHQHQQQASQGQQLQKSMYGNFPPTVNPSQLLGGGMSNMVGAINPAQLNSVVMGGGINPSSLMTGNNAMNGAGVNNIMMANMARDQQLNLYAAQERARLAAAQSRGPFPPQQQQQPIMHATPSAMQQYHNQISVRSQGAMTSNPAAFSSIQQTPRPPTGHYENGISSATPPAFFAGSPPLGNVGPPLSMGLGTATSMRPRQISAEAGPHLQHLQNNTQGPTNYGFRPPVPPGMNGTHLNALPRFPAAPSKPVDSPMHSTPTIGHLPPNMLNTPARSQGAHQVASAAHPPSTSQAKNLPKAATTLITIVPAALASKEIPELTASEIENVKKWRSLDDDYEQTFNDMRKRMGTENQETIGRPMWWEQSNPPLRPKEKFDLQYPRKGRKGRRVGLRLPRKVGEEAASKPELLVPIRLEFDVEHHKMRDSFVWNLNDPLITPEIFAQTVVEDYALAQSYHSTITKIIQEQLSDYQAHVLAFSDSPIESGLISGKMDDADERWWKDYNDGRGRKRRKVLKDVDRKPEINAPEDSMRILVKLDIIVGTMKLDDQFEWDLENPDADPELFAEIYTQDLGLGGEFKTAIAHTIREHVVSYQKSLFLVGHPGDGANIPDEELRLAFLPNLDAAARPAGDVQSFTPLLNYLSDGELDRTEKERDKEMTKRRKRINRGRRGIPLPDREPIRTYRTSAIGFPELDAATLTQIAAASAPTSRRAAAAAASLTIAHMAAEENGMAPYVSHSTPVSNNAATNPTATSKEKKIKGHFKAPKLPATVLIPRAQVVAPTPSTASDAAGATVSRELDSMRNTIPFDSKAAKISELRQAREREREAKDKEYADGQHANIIDGIWHCSNCGCPEPIAIGRRKGPLGDKSQCGACGKYWHQYRKPKAVEYNTSADYHLELQKKVESGAKVVKKRAATKAIVAPNARATTPQPLRAVEVPGPNISSPENSYPTISQLNGYDHGKSGSANASAAAEGWTAGGAPSWLVTSMRSLMVTYPDDKFILRRVNDNWRIKCHDCPGKLYTPGPEETLTNFEIHLKNRIHLQRVADRLAGVTPAPEASPAQ